MLTTNDLNEKAEQLKAELQQIELDKKQAAETERNQRLDEIAAAEDRANGYRNQAAKALNDEDKQRLYRYAEEQDEHANELRKELGLVSQEDLQAGYNEKLQAEQQATYRKINVLFIKSAMAFMVFLLTDYCSGMLDAGFISFLLKSVAQISWVVSVAFGGTWLASTILLSFLIKYGFAGLRTDFGRVSPAVRLGLLTGLLLAFLHFLSAIVPNAN